MFRRRSGDIGALGKHMVASTIPINESALCGKRDGCNLVDSREKDVV